MSRPKLNFLHAVAVLVCSSLALLRAQPPTIGTGAVAITVTSSANPALYAQSVTFSVTVAAAAATPTATTSVPSGTVIASISGNFELGAITLDTGGHGVILVPELSGLSDNTAIGMPAGSDTITFYYAGDSKYKSAQTTLNEFVNKADTTTVAAIQGSGQPAQLTATVSIQEAGATNLLFELPGNMSSSAPTGTVQFYNGSALIGAATLKPSGLFTSTATLATDAIPATVSATYAGDSNYNGSNSSTVGGGGGGSGFGDGFGQRQPQFRVLRRAGDSERCGDRFLHAATHRFGDRFAIGTFQSGKRDGRQQRQGDPHDSGDQQSFRRPDCPLGLAGSQRFHHRDV